MDKVCSQINKIVMYPKVSIIILNYNGWKKLKGYKGLIKYKPTFLWQRILDLTQKITYYFPNLAFQLFAVKKLKKIKDEFS